MTKIVIDKAKLLEHPLINPKDIKEEIYICNGVAKIQYCIIGNSAIQLLKKSLKVAK